MRITPVLILVVISINLSACSTMSGNVVPEQGLTMEQVYDNMEVTKVEHKPQVRRTCSHTVTPMPRLRNNQSFQKLRNPTLTMYVYPHFAGKDELPIPGYETVFNAYERDHYVI